MRRKFIHSLEPDALGSDEKIKFLRQTRQVIAWISIILTLLFSIIQFSYMHGTLNDANIQELAYARLPKTWSIGAYLAVAMLTLSAIALCWAEGDIRRFTVVLVIFTIIDHLAWRYLIRELKNYREFSEKLYKSRKNLFSLVKLSLVVNQVQGNWKWFRLTAGCIIIAIMAVFAFSEQVQSLTVSRIISFIPGINSNRIVDIVGSAFVLIWVFIMEGWHWYMRIRTTMRIQFIEQDLEEKYDLHSNST